MFNLSSRQDKVSNFIVNNAYFGKNLKLMLVSGPGANSSIKVVRYILNCAYFVF